MRRGMLWLMAGLILLGFFYLTAVPGSLLHRLNLHSQPASTPPTAARASVNDDADLLARPASYTPGLPHPVTLLPYPARGPTIETGRAEAIDSLTSPTPLVPADGPAQERETGRLDGRERRDDSTVLPEPVAHEQESPTGHTRDEDPARARRPEPPAAEEVSRVSWPAVRVVTFNIRHALGSDGQVSLERVAEALKGADIAFLSEVDRFWLRSGLRDQPAVLQELTGMPHAFFAPALDLPGPSRQYGNLLLSRFPILEAETVPLPRPEGAEARVMIEARVDVYGEDWFVSGVHLGLDREERRLQVEAVQARVASTGPHRILLGDLNAPLEAPEVRSLLEGEGPAWIDGLAGAPATFPAWRPTARIDHVLLSPSLAARRQASGVDSSDASDHLPAWVDVRVNDRPRAQGHRPSGLQP